MIIRSAFWLCVGFALVAPHGVDFGAAAAQATDKAIEAGSQTVAQIVLDHALKKGTLEIAPSGLVSASPAAHPTRDLSTPSFVFPRPRPAAIG